MDLTPVDVCEQNELFYKLLNCMTISNFSYIPSLSAIDLWAIRLSSNFFTLSKHERTDYRIYNVLMNHQVMELAMKFKPIHCNWHEFLHW